MPAGWPCSSMNSTGGALASPTYVNPPGGTQDADGLVDWADATASAIKPMARAAPARANQLRDRMIQLHSRTHSREGGGEISDRHRLGQKIVEARFVAGVSRLGGDIGRHGDQPGLALDPAQHPHRLDP